MTRSSRPSERNATAGRSRSDDGRVEVHIFECGYGDTILLGLPGAKWVLVDCHLPRGRVRDRFFRFVEERGITSLDLVVLTHADQDHFRGMLEVVNYFTSGQRSIKRYADSGVDPKQMLDLLGSTNRPPSAIGEYSTLHSRLTSLFADGSVSYHPVDENTAPIRVEDPQLDIRLVPISPEPRLVRQLQRDTLSAGELRRSLNGISVVLLLHVRADTRSFNILLAGDADASSLDRALRIWEKRGASDGWSPELDAVKVPHHGSAGSQTDRLYQAVRNRGESIAAISAGVTRRSLPSADVIRKYLSAGWTVVVTTKRAAPAARDHAFELAGRRQREIPEVRRYDIRIAWDSREGLSWGPPEAEVTASDLA